MQHCCSTCPDLRGLLGSTLPLEKGDQRLRWTNSPWEAAGKRSGKVRGADYRQHAVAVKTIDLRHEHVISAVTFNG